MRIEKGKIVISTDKRLNKFSFGEEESIPTVNLPAFTYEGSFEVDASVFDNAMKNAGVIGAEVFELEVKDKKFQIRTASKANEFIEIADADFADTKCRFKGGMKDVFGNLKGKLKVSLKKEKEYPMMVEYSDEFVNAKYYISPFMGEP